MRGEAGKMNITSPLSFKPLPFPLGVYTPTPRFPRPLPLWLLFCWIGEIFSLLITASLFFWTEEKKEGGGNWGEVWG